MLLKESNQTGVAALPYFQSYLENGVILASIFGIVAFQQTSAGCIP